MKKLLPNALRKRDSMYSRGLRGYWDLDEIHQEGIGIWMKNYWDLNEELLGFE